MEHLQVTSVGAVGFMQEWLGSEWDSPEKELAKRTEKELPKRSVRGLGLLGRSLGITQHSCCRR